MGFAESKYDGWLDRHFEPGTGCLTVLELGCGWGDDTSFLAQTGHNIIACDIAEDAVRNIRARYPGVTAKCFDLREPFPFPADMADMVIASLCLHFFPEPELRCVLGEIKRVLKPDGTFLCRLNSERGRTHGVAGETELEPGLYMTREGIKRFYDETMIRSAFDAWRIIHIEEYETVKFSKGKVLFELAMVPG